MAGSLSETDKKVLALAWQCFESIPKVDVKKLAELGGYKTPASANTAYHKARSKLLAGATLNDGDAKSTRSSPTKRAATEEKETPKKRGRKGKSGKGADGVGTSVEGAADQDDGEMEVKKEVRDEDGEEDGVDGLLAGTK